MFDDYDQEPEEADVQIISYDEITHTTDKAILYSKGNREFWVPKSVVITDEDNEVVLPSWFTVDLKFKDRTPFS
jgi:hypothetical protein